jgi:predicted RNA-binding protein with RPS1 domain
VMDFGCFVELREFPAGEGGKRPEGLVHVSQITNGMLRDPKQAVKRGQRVRVKVCVYSCTSFTDAAHIFHVSAAVVLQ